MGFETETVCDDSKVKFICPFCKPETKAKLNQLVEKGVLRRVKSNKNKVEYFAFVPT